MLDRELKLRVVLEAIDKATGYLKAVMNGSGAMAKAVRQARDSLKELEAANAKLDAFRTTSRDLAVASNAAGATQKTIARLRAEIAATESPTRAQNRALQDAINNAGRLKEQIQNLTEKQQRLRTELEQAGMPTRNLAQNQVELRKRIDEATQALEREQKALKENGAMMQRYHAAKARAEKIRNFGSKAQSIGTTAGMAGAAVTAAVAFPVKAYADAEDAATQLKVAMMGVGGKVPETFTQINELAGKLGNRLPGTTADYQNMMTMLVRQGMSAQAILGGLGEATAYLGVQLKMPMDAAAEFASKLQDATRTSEKDMMGLMDQIQRAFYLGVDSNNMLNAFSSLTSAMDTIKLKGLEGTKTLMPLVAMLDQSSLVGESAGNALRKVFQKSIDLQHIGKANAALSEFGIKLDFTNGKGNFGGMDNFFRQVEKLKAIGNTQKRNKAIKALFGDDDEVMKAISIVMDKGKAGYEEMQAKMAAQADIQTRVNAQLNTLKSLWDAASGTFVNALVNFGESVAPELHATAAWLGAVADGTQAWAKENPGLASAIMTVAKWLGIFLTFGGAAAVVIGALAVTVAALTFAMGALGISIAPLLLTLGAIGLIGVAAVALITYWEPIKGFFIDIADGVATRWNALIGWFGEIPARMSNIGQQIVDGMWSGIKSGWAWMIENVTGLVDLLPQAVRAALGIHSPSRVFAEIGTFTMAGMEQGLEDGGKDTLATIGRITRQLTAAGVIGLSGAAVASGFSVDTRGPVSAGTAALPTGGNHYEIHVYGAPGMDEQMLAELVAREMDKRDRNTAAQRRSSLRDLD